MAIKSLVALAMLIFQSSVLLAQSTSHPWHVVDNGGGNSTAGGNTLQSSVGQPSGTATSTNGATLEPGYIPGLRVLSGTSSALDVAIESGWNLISVPFRVADFRKSVLYPSGMTKAYNYNAGYQTHDTLVNGLGYWIRFGAAGIGHFTGASIFQDTIDLHDGWNMIGCLSVMLRTADLQQLDSTSFTTPFWSYSSVSGYSHTDTLRPGKGYWIKVRNSGRLLMKLGSVMNDRLVASAGKKSPEGLKDVDFAKDVSRLTVRDALGRERTVYFAQKRENIEPEKWEVPPIPFDGIMDVRFASNRLIESEDASKPKEVGIKISSAEYPVTISWHALEEMRGARLKIEDKEIELTGGGERRIVSADGHLALIFAPSSRKEVPKRYALYQNYPNPFNPTTVIRYDLPMESIVSLKLFNVLGEEVQTLVEGTEEAGFKSVEWHAADAPSGVYFYRLEVRALESGERMADVRKLLLVK